MNDAIPLTAEQQLAFYIEHLKQAGSFSLEYLQEMETEINAARLVSESLGETTR